MNLKYMKVSLFEITYKKKFTFLRHSNLLRCTCTVTDLDINACPGQVDFLKGRVKEENFTCPTGQLI